MYECTCVCVCVPLMHFHAKISYILNRRHATVKCTCCEFFSRAPINYTKYIRTSISFFIVRLFSSLKSNRSIQLSHNYCELVAQNGHQVIERHRQSWSCRCRCHHCKQLLLLNDEYVLNVYADCSLCVCVSRKLEDFIAIAFYCDMKMHCFTLNSNKQ